MNLTQKPKQSFIPRCLAALICAVLWLGAAGAVAQSINAEWTDWDREAQRARSVIDAGAASPSALEDLRKRLEDQKSGASKVADAASSEISRVTAELDALGPAPEGDATEAPAAAELRKELRERVTAAEADRGRAQRVVARVENILSDLARLGQQNFFDRLETRGPSPLNPTVWVDAKSDIVKLHGRLRREVDRGLAAPSEQDDVLGLIAIAVAALAIGLFILFGVRGFALGLLSRRAEKSDNRSRKLVFGLGLTAARIVISMFAAIFIVIALSIFGSFGAVGETIVGSATFGVLTVILAYALAAALFSPEAAGLRLFNLSTPQARSAFRATMALAVVIGLDHLLVAAVSSLAYPDATEAITTFVMITLGAIALYRLAIVLAPSGDGLTDASIVSQAYHILRRVVLVVSFVTPVLALIGFSEAARYFFFPMTYSAALIAAAYLVFAVIREVVDVFLAHDEGRAERFRLIPVFVGFVLFCAVVPVLALIWGASALDIHAAYRVAAAGLVVGDIAISPVDFVMFALVFGIGYTLTRAAQRVLNVSVLPRTSMSEGGASALVSGVGYVGVFIAAIAAISATGIDLSNLAIVFGALSVGIGFGLQNIVNNFVSGIILLVERPIKVGDWIDVGGQSGYVKKVNVRSTEIETFDRASYIVPNSDLISAPVLNWTHTNKVGRVRNKIGVAYGTDPRKVEKILGEIGRAHPMVINNPAPAVYFMGFGADSLDFELRTYLNDVNWMLSVSSDINFRINERFIEEGIEIPFAQRDLHIKNPEALMEIVDRRREPGGEA